MTAKPKKASILTVLVVSKEKGIPARRGGDGQRQQYEYFLPLIDSGCHGAFCACYDIGSATATRYKNQTDEGRFSAKLHGGQLNHNAAVVDTPWIVDWMKRVAAGLGGAGLYVFTAKDF
ncbi:hypothetical protein GN244_ATG00113 [Phytophthora infestans]|uniref:Uncharacterized protein n=1 Tax=Phytophthora infestans TaxID=4787 RepID=A0A833TD37_PHYIN|nr:hypothetical protein GN244_ATG00113 [Phytophthora infestans]KAF4150101.1 hypothetical protein GN958_ATG00727 [Phytophthora infestans]